MTIGWVPELLCKKLAAAFLEELTVRSNSPNEQWREIPNRNGNSSHGLKRTWNETPYTEHFEK